MFIIFTFIHLFHVTSTICVQVRGKPVGESQVFMIGSNYLYLLSYLRSPMHIYSGMFFRRSKIRWTISEEVIYSGSLALSRVLQKLFLDFVLLPFSNSVVQQGQNWMPLRSLSESTATSIVGKALSLAGILLIKSLLSEKSCILWSCFVWYCSRIYNRLL